MSMAKRLDTSIHWSSTRYANMAHSVACMTAFGVFLSGFVKVIEGDVDRSNHL